MSLLKEGLERRSLLKGGLGAGLLGLFTGSPVKVEAPPPLLTGATIPRMNYGLSAVDALLNPEKKSALRLFRMMSARRSFSHEARVNGIEPDLACLRSVKPAVKAIMQRVRDQHYSDIDRRYRAFLWPDNYDEDGYYKDEV